jgi:hypothetical protein
MWIGKPAPAMQGYMSQTLHCKKGYLFFPSPAGMSLTKLSLAGNKVIVPGQGDFGY